MMDVQRRVAREEGRYFRRPLVYAARAAEIAGRILGDPDLRAFLFGSAAAGRAIPGASDVDVLLVSERAPKTAREAAELRIRILSELGDLAAPLEIHVVTPEEFTRRWRRVRGMVPVPIRVR